MSGDKYYNCSCPVCGGLVEKSFQSDTDNPKLVLYYCCHCEEQFTLDQVVTEDEDYSYDHWT